MHKYSSSFLIQKLYLPLGLVVALALFALMFMHSAQEKERTSALQVREIQHLSESLHQANLILRHNGQAQLAVILEQIENSLARAEASMPAEYTSTEEAADFFLLKEGSERLLLQWKAVTPGNAQAVATHRLGASLEELEEMSLLLSKELNTKLSTWEKLKNGALTACLLLCLAALLYAFYFLQHYVLKPLVQLEQKLGNKLQESTNTTLITQGLLAGLYKKIEGEKEQATYLAQVADQIGDGNFLQDEEQLHQAGFLGNSLLRLRQKMQAYFQADQRRSWGAQGIEQFTKLLREEGQDVDRLCKNLISQLVPFMNANQGAVFTVAGDSGEQPDLELKAAYAWGRHKHMSKTIAYGEGLIGQVAQEKDMLLLTDVPDNFISIGSGLGKAKPKCVLIMPLITNDIFQGVLELASFRVFEEHELEFLKKLNESLASTLLNLKVNFQTKDLLQKANAANSHLQSQEEELRQNTEELMATQEAMRKKENEFTVLFTSIDNSLFTAEFDLDGLLLSTNEKFKGHLNIQERELGNKSCFELLQVPSWKEHDKAEFMQKLRAGLSQNLECSLMRKPGSWIAASFTPVLNDRGKVQKIMMLASDISEKKEAELAYIAQAEEITRQEERLRSYTAELEGLQASLSDRLKQAQQEMELQFREIALEKEKNLAILEGCVDGVVSFNERGIIEFFNHAAEEIWEMSREEALGNAIQKLISIKIQDTDNSPQVYFSRNGSLKMLDVRTEVPIIGAGGEEIDALLTLTRIKVGDHYMFTAFVQKVAVELF